MKEHNVLILGGGFAGLKCALELGKKKLKNVRITLVSDRPHFEYHGALYRLVSGHSPLEVCIPIRDVLNKKLGVDFSVEEIISIDKERKEVKGKEGSVFAYDTLVIALGAETNYFNIGGLEEYSFGVKTVKDALELKSHIHEVIESCAKGERADNLCAGNFVVVGGGATGVELASELAVYTKKLAKRHDIHPSLMNVELIEAGPRILPLLPQKFTKRIEEKVRSLGVNLRFNRALEKSELQQVYLKDMELKTKTVVWTAGVQANHLVREAGFPVNKIGKTLVTDRLEVVDHPDVYSSGDAADTKESGMAQTALYDGEYIADSIEKKLKNKTPKRYQPKTPIYAIPAGPGWAGTMFGSIRVYGKTGWALRRVVDLVVYMSLLPLSKIWSSFSSHKLTCEACPVCCKYDSEY